MNLQNIYNSKRKIHLFLRDDEGNQIIEQDDSFFPYYFEPDPDGKFVGYDGKPLRKAFCSEPGQVRELRSPNSYEADIRYPRRYIIDKVPAITPSKVRYIFLDIEVLTKEFPDFRRSIAPISCISVYDSFTEKIDTWYLGDIMEAYGTSSIKNAEQHLLKLFLDWMDKTRPDIWFSWNVDFDYNYLQSRVEKFAQKISPIGKVRLPMEQNKEENIFYPAGMSIVDYLSWFKKVYMREQSYKLDSVAEKYLGEELWQETKFSELNPVIKAKNINDVKRMVKLEEKFGLISYYDEIRRMSRSQWEDLYHNSRIIEMLLFEEAKKKNIVLPNKPIDNEKEEFQGATRDVGKPGVSYNIGKYDLTAAYPSMMIDFCLDPSNMAEQMEENTLEIDGNYVRQNSEALLPSVLKSLLVLKNDLKKEKRSNPSKNSDTKYDAIKAVVNSGYGVMGNRFFRLYDKRVAALTTFLVRDVLINVKDRLEQENKEVLYFDTDSVFINSQENITNRLNDFITEWSMSKFNKDASLEFEYEGQFTKILILKKCRYFGYLDTGKEIKEEIKGVEIKRSDSSKFMATFQRALIDKLLDGASKKKIRAWILEEADRMKRLPLDEVALPCKISKSESEYKSVPIFVRALRYTKELISFEKDAGEIFYYIYVKPFGYEQEGEIAKYFKRKRITDEEINKLSEEDQKKIRERQLKPKKPKDVIAFDKVQSSHIPEINWNKMLERNIISKTEVIFEALGWEDQIEPLKGGLLCKEETANV